MSSIIGDIVEQEAKSLGISLSFLEKNAFELYATELKKWNRKVNLTAITKDKEIAVKHFIDSLTLLPYISEANRLLDIGSGAGLPVIPLKIIRPDISMLSVDAVAKKINFQRHIVRLLKLKNIETIHARIEKLHETHCGAFNIIISRAFARLGTFVSLAAPLLAENGMLIAMKGVNAENEITTNNEAIEIEGFFVTAVHRYNLPFGMGERVLTFLKQNNTL